jgi:transglutaminase-like putative cysteine protease
MLRKFFGSLLFITLAYGAFPQPATEFLGLFLQNQRIGLVTITNLHEPSGRRSVVKTVLEAQLLGTPTRLEIASEAWIGSTGHLVKQVYSITSGGRDQRITAHFLEKTVQVIRESEGASEKKELPVPEGALLVDDPMSFAWGKEKPEKGSKVTFYWLDPMALALLRGEVHYLGAEEKEILGKKQKAEVFHIITPQGTMETYWDEGGKFLWGKMMLGIEIRPLTRDEALEGTKGYVPSIDLATASRILPDKPISQPRLVESLTLRVEGSVPLRLPSDGHQEISRNEGDGVIIRVRPPQPTRADNIPIKQLRGQEAFLKDASYLNLGDETLRSTLKRIVSGSENVMDVVKRVTDFVYKEMRPNASIALLRDAREVLRTKEGVCRDYAILTASLLRASGIPTKLVTGMVYSDGAFYYHAWVEVWTGTRWIGVDPTLNQVGVDATHVKFAEGNPEEAFVVSTLDGVKLTVLNLTHRESKGGPRP